MNVDTSLINPSDFKEEQDQIENKFSLHSELVIKEDPCETLLSDTEWETKFSPQLDLLIKQENTVINPTTVSKSESIEFDSRTATQSDIENVFIKPENESDTEETIESVNPEARIFQSIYENGRKAYKCSFCNFSTANLIPLQQHMYIHYEMKLFDCSACKYCSSRSDELTKHLLRKHVGKGLKCCICNYTATNQGNLKAHMNTHKRDNPYKCNRCEYSSKDVQNLQKHIKERHTILKCDQCNFQSVSRRGLHEHCKKIHTPVGKKDQYVCKSCYFCTLKEDEFKIHMDMHVSGGKTYRCDQCNYRDKNIALLKTHMETHLE